MSRPLTIFLQLLGLILIVVGAAPETNFTTIAIGVAMAIAGGIGTRSRRKKAD